ncbi:hypothetical protein ESP51_06145 [Agromyces albus]|uniref:Uncharacterized protein n=1 Tax=Agromyces albus TaxID=205332 RepID=A0A4Q2L1K5_9MICO|nr:hypothetical protein ESP51_06145 [Agromyces albus]
MPPPTVTVARRLTLSVPVAWNLIESADPAFAFAGAYFVEPSTVVVAVPLVVTTRRIELCTSPAG